MAYGLGCIAINIITFYILNVEYLVLLACGMVVVTVYPSFISYFESPMWLGGKGHFTRLMQTFVSIKVKNSMPTMFSKVKIDLNAPSSIELQQEFIEIAFPDEEFRDFDVRVIKSLHAGDWVQLSQLLSQNSTPSLSSGDRATSGDVENQLGSEKSALIENDDGWILSISKESSLHENISKHETKEAFKELCTNKVYLCQFVSLSFIASLMFMVFYGMTTSVQELGLKNIQLNGMMIGVCQTIGYLFILPFTHKIPRKQFMKMFQVVIVSSAIVLFLIGLFVPHSDARKWIETLISTVLISSLTSMMFPLLFLWIAELFPTQIKGLASAFILFMGKLLGGLAPILTHICEKNGIHILVGCCSIGFISVVATGYLRETYDPHAGEEDQFKIKPTGSGKFVVAAPKHKKLGKKKQRKESLDLKCTN